MTKARVTITDSEFEEVKAQRDQAIGRAEVAEQELAAANAELAKVRELHEPMPVHAGEYEDGTCAYCNADRHEPLPPLRRYRGHLNGAKALTWMHAHPDQWPTCAYCIGTTTSYDTDLAAWPCDTARALGMELPAEWVQQ